MIPAATHGCKSRSFAFCSSATLLLSLRTASLAPPPFHSFPPRTPFLTDSPPSYRIPPSHCVNLNPPYSDFTKGLCSTGTWRQHRDQGGPMLVAVLLTAVALGADAHLSRRGMDARARWQNQSRGEDRSEKRGAGTEKGEAVVVVRAGEGLGGESDGKPTERVY